MGGACSGCTLQVFFSCIYFLQNTSTLEAAPFFVYGYAFDSKGAVGPEGMSIPYGNDNILFALINNTRSDAFQGQQPNILFDGIHDASFALGPIPETRPIEFVWEILNGVAVILFQIPNDATLDDLCSLKYNNTCPANNTLPFFCRDPFQCNGDEQCVPNTINGTCTPGTPVVCPPGQVCQDTNNGTICISVPTEEPTMGPTTSTIAPITPTAEPTSNIPTGTPTTLIPTAVPSITAMPTVEAPTSFPLAFFLPIFLVLGIMIVVLIVVVVYIVLNQRSRRFY
jgi:hypothetical protein